MEERDRKLVHESPYPNTWRHRFQHVRLRTKIAVPMVVLAVVPTMLVGLFMISQARSTLHARALRRVQFDTATKAGRLKESLEAVREDVIFLSQARVIRDLAAADARGESARVTALREAVEQELLVFSQGKRAYYQVRYLNSVGREVVRLDVVEGAPRFAPAAELQDKSHRDYVREVLKLSPGAIYVSPMNLNLEHGRVELPPRGVVRVATPVEASGAKAGMLVINVYAGFLLSVIGPVPDTSEAWLIDEAGHYLGYVGSSETRADLYGLEQERDLAADYSDAETAAILAVTTNGKVLETPRGLVSFARIAYAGSQSDRSWVLMIADPLAPILAPIRMLTVLLLVGMFFVVAAAGTLGVLVASYVVNPLANMRRATREIAAGNLSKQVEVSTGDELEGLARDFNAMTVKLREAQERVSAWNVELEREVERKTEHLHELQSGLARADKLATVGQIAAGVMHEIGNPLASIKTNIQVTQGTEHKNRVGCQPCVEMMDQVLGEVDRLASFLRSFSRMARLREPDFRELRLDEVANGVMALVAPELRRRGVQLRVESEADVPAIRGDVDQLRQLLINLILNAMEILPEGGEVLVQVLQRPAGIDSDGGPGAGVEVVDAGPGMTPEIIDKIWDPFFTTKLDGTGLGLAICRQIVEAHGGVVEVFSRPGQGTTVSVTFPPLVRTEARSPA